MEIALTKLKQGKTAIIKQMGECPQFKEKICSLGARPGKKITLISSHPFRGPLVVEIEGMRLAVGRGMAEKIIVEVEDR